MTRWAAVAAALVSAALGAHANTDIVNFSPGTLQASCRPWKAVVAHLLGNDWTAEAIWQAAPRHQLASNTSTVVTGELGQQADTLVRIFELDSLHYASPDAASQPWQARVSYAAPSLHEVSLWVVCGAPAGGQSATIPAVDASTSRAVLALVATRRAIVVPGRTHRATAFVVRCERRFLAGALPETAVPYVAFLAGALLFGALFLVPAIARMIDDESPTKKRTE